MSNINPNNINGTFPIAGQDNDSQGFRDNFTNILGNFSFAKAELEDLQSKVVLKTALSGTVLDNGMGFNELANVRLRSWSQTVYDYTNTTSPTVAIDFNQGNFFHFTTSSAISLSVSGWPANGQYAAVRVWMGIANTSHTIQFPATVNINTADIAGFGYNGLNNTITFETAGNYLFEIGSYNGGVSYILTDLSRNRSTVAGNLSVSGNLITSGGLINTKFFEATVGNSQNFFANIGYNTYVIDTASSATISNLRISLPNTAVNGQTLTFSALAPITACYLDAGGAGKIKWVANTWAGSGNTAVTLTYSTTSSSWLRTG